MTRRRSTSAALVLMTLWGTCLLYTSSPGLSLLAAGPVGGKRDLSLSPDWFAYGENRAIFSNGLPWLVRAAGCAPVPAACRC